MLNHPTVSTALAMIAFAGNSILCRLALGEGSIDAESFTLVRVGTGAVVLMVLAGLRNGRRLHLADLNHWRPALALAIYLFCFSLAYLQLDAGTGALILFIAVQLTMLGAAWLKGERPDANAILGFVLAIGGLVLLLGPGNTTIDIPAAILMAASGAAWGLYSLIGRKSQQPLSSATGSFLLALPICLALCAPSINHGLHWDERGLLLAALSGGVGSALGYALWYTALPHLKTIQAAAAQLTVPVLAALGGLFFLNEPVTVRGLTAGGTTLAGVWLLLQHTMPDRLAVRAKSTGDRK